MQTLLFKLLKTLFLSFFFLIYLHGSVASPIAIDMNSTTTGVLTDESEISPNSYNASEYYTFTLTEDKNISISLESDIYYKMYLLDNYGSIIKEASKYNHKKKKIIVTLAQGTYRIDVTTVFNDSHGSFMLMLKENIIETRSITLDTILDGEWTNNSGISPGSIQHSNYYTFILSERTDVVIDLECNSPYLYLLDNNHNVIENSKNSVNGHTKIIKTLEAGTYTIDVTNDSYNNGIGIYTLRFKINTISTTEIDLSSTTEGTWSLASGISPRSKQYTNYYTFTIDEDIDIAIEIDTSISNTKMYLLDSNNTIIAESNYRNFILKHLSAGTYTIDTTLSWTRTGDFSIYLHENIISNTPIEMNSSIHGEWTNISGLSENTGGYTNYYTFTLNESKDIVITLSGGNARFYILDENGKRINNYMYFSETIVKTFEAGTYMIEVTQYNKKEGEYQLLLRENTITNKMITLNSIIKGKWSSTDGISPYTYGHGYVKRYTFTLFTRTDILIDLNSSINNKRLFLTNSNNIDDMIYSNGHSHIVTTLDAGTYIIDVTCDSVDKNKTGTFILNLKENIIERTLIILNTLKKGSWTENSGVSNYEGYINQYTFSLAEKTTVYISLQSEYAKYMKLGTYSAYSENSEDLFFSKILNAGTYVVDVIISDRYNHYQTGDYTLFIQADIKTALPISQLNVQFLNAYNSIITWKKGSSDTVGYKIYLDDKLIANIDKSENSYALNGLEPNSEHTYSVVAYNSAGESEAVSGSFKTKKDDYAWLIPVQYNILN